jgi:serine/threonine protein phosphatase PrpC
MRKDTVFCGVFDGHGPYGHLVARRVRDSLPSKLASIWKSRIRGDPSSAGEIHSNPDSGKANMAWADQQQTPIMELIDDDDDEGGEEEEEKEMEEEESKTFVNWRDSFLEAFDSMDWDLRKHPAIDSFCSGSTAVVVLKQVSPYSFFSDAQISLKVPKSFGS